MIFNIILLHFAFSSCVETEETCSQKFITKILAPKIQPEGDGARVRRIIGSDQLDSLDPLLMLDHFYAEPPAGFPDHPHRGFETITYMLDGVCVHEDFLGNHGEIAPGDLQWMTAGRGIVHAEMPKSGPMEGLQLWLNLNSSQKMTPPLYQGLQSSEVPVFSCEAFSCKILSGSAFSFASPILTKTPIYFWDVLLHPSQHFTQRIPKGFNTLVYVLEGLISISGKKLEKHCAAVLSLFGLGIDVYTEVSSRFVLISGQKLSEKVARNGPFVMNDMGEIFDAIEDYKGCRNGFERAEGWRSSIL